ncbi:MAG: FAD:protein FMN transferase [Deltaproteobacteria bacterium]|nr:FAD:protein FMN transferase [Deltaproteobacteria bacterium]
MRTRTPLLSLLLLALAAVIPASGARAALPAAPPLELPRLDGSGKVRLSDFLGKVVVVDFWATWCVPCKDAMPEHEKLRAEFGKDVEILAISLDETAEAPREYVTSHHLTLDFLHDPKGVTPTAYHVSAMPYAVVIDRLGHIVERIEGEPYPALRDAVRRVVGGGKAPGPPPVPPPPRSLEDAPPPGGCPGLLTRVSGGMGSKVTVALCPVDGVDSAAAAETAVAEVDRLNRLWSTWLPESEVSRINRAAGGRPVAVSAETFDVISRARQASVDTGGIFDITFAPLGEIWKFDTPPGAHQPTRLERVPTPAEVRSHLARVGYRGLELDAKAHTVRLARKGMAIHLGGIGKGAAVDSIVAQLRGKGFHDFMVQAGGDLYCAGHNGSRPWRVGIAHPRERGAVIATVDVEDAAFSTSGDYERYAIIDGKRYHHIIDLRTGYPASKSQSATVLAATATDAEVLTKAAFILGGAEGLDAVERAGGEAVIVEADGDILWSEALRPGEGER